MMKSVIDDDVIDLYTIADIIELVTEFLLIFLSF